MNWRRPRLHGWHIAVIALFSAACTAGAGGGMIGAIATALVIAAGLFAACSNPPDKNNDPSNVQACLSIQPDWGMDAGNNDDPDIGPCLQPPPPDMNDAGPDPVDFGPCLQPPPPDFGTDTGSGGDMSMDMMGAAPAPNRSQILARLGDRLPADVAQRLGDDDSQA